MEIRIYFLVLDYKIVWIVSVGHSAVFFNFSCHCLLIYLGILRKKQRDNIIFPPFLPETPGTKGIIVWPTTCPQEKIFSVDLKILLDRKCMSTLSKLLNYSRFKISTSQYSKIPSITVPLPKQCNLKWPFYLTCWIIFLKVSFLPYGSEFEKYITAISQT